LCDSLVQAVSELAAAVDSVSPFPAEGVSEGEEGAEETGVVEAEEEVEEAT